MPQTNTFASFLTQVDYSLMDSLNADPESTDNGRDHQPRQVFSGHYVPVTPTPLPNHEYIAHSFDLFEELGLSQDLAQDEHFSRLFSGDITVAKDPMRPFGWATGYALRSTAPSTLSNVLFGLEMAMEMDAPYLYSRAYLKVQTLGDAIERWWANTILSRSRRTCCPSFQCPRVSSTRVHACIGGSNLPFVDTLRVKIRKGKQSSLVF